MKYKMKILEEIKKLTSDYNEDYPVVDCLIIFTDTYPLGEEIEILEYDENDNTYMFYSPRHETGMWIPASIVEVIE